MEKMRVLILYTIIFFILFNSDNRVFNDKVVIAFTFDDGPSEYTRKIAHLLYTYQYGATFFQIGNKVKEDIDIIDYLSARDLEIGSHGFNHFNYLYLDKDDILREINTHIILTENRVKYFRPPYGLYNKMVVSLINKPIILWNKDTLDWKIKDRYAISDYILNNYSAGDIFLMHDVYEETYEALKIVLPMLKDRGVVVTCVSGLFDYYNIPLENSKVYYNIKSTI